MKLFRQFFFVFGIVSFLWCLFMFSYVVFIKDKNSTKVENVKVSIPKIENQYNEKYLKQASNYLYPKFFLDCFYNKDKMLFLEENSKKDFYSELPLIKKHYFVLKKSCDQHLLFNNSYLNNENDIKDFILTFEEEYNYYYDK